MANNAFASEGGSFGKYNVKHALPANFKSYKPKRQNVNRENNSVDPLQKKNG